jgi:Tfp pilus assembly protein PilF
METQVYPSSYEALLAAAKFHTAGQWQQAESIYRQVLAREPNNVTALHNMGELAFRLRRYDIGLELLTRAVALDPNDANHVNSLAVVTMSVGRQDESYELCKRAINLNPRFANAHSNLAICLVNRGEMDQALAEFKMAIELDPNNACAHDGLGLTLLMMGDLQNGWREQEWRWLKYDFPPNRYPGTTHWHGEDLAGKTLALYVEQGYGDVFQFCRYVPLLADRGAKVYMESVKELGQLMERSLPGLAGTFPPNQPPPHDFLCPLMSVPMWYGTTLQTIPAPVGYLKPDPREVEAWRGFFSTDPSLKIGIAWAGRPTHNNDLNRSTSLSTFAPLAAVPGVTFYGLQKGPLAAQALQPPAGMRIIDLSSRLTDFEVTTAIISHLDMVIAVDTVVVHIAGALGKPAWPILPFCPDWRWLLVRRDSPWYPTMRLFRQPRRGDWITVIHEVAAALAQVKRKF